VLRLGFDGLFPREYLLLLSLLLQYITQVFFFAVSCQNNYLRTIMKTKNTTSFLHPGVQIDIQLQQRNPIDILIDRADLPEEVVWQTPVARDIGEAAKKYRISIRKITLLYESAILQDLNEVARINRSTLLYPLDTPIERWNALDGGVMMETVNVPLPRGSRMVYLFFMHETQRIPFAVKNGFMPTRFRWPPYLDRMNLSLVGKSNLIFQRGFRDINNPRNSVSLRTFHAELVKKNLYSKDFDSWCPAERHGVPADIIIPLDLSPYFDDFSEICNLTVELGYTQASRPNWGLRSYSVVQRVYSYSERDMWTYKDTLP
jgi:hypothetical protein